MELTVGDLIGIMEDVAPASLAEEWDNVGLQVGSRQWPVRSVVVALDPTVDVVDHACRQEADALITHHPLTLKPFRTLDMDSPLGRVVQLAVDHHLAVFSAHTNLDSVSGGLNDLLADRIGLQAVKTLVPAPKDRTARLEIIVPDTMVDRIVRRLGRSLAGGPDESIGDAIVTPGDAGIAIEVKHATGNVFQSGRRIDLVMDRKHTGSVIRSLKVHFPETPILHELRSITTSETPDGLGRVGDLVAPVPLNRFAQDVKRRLKLHSVRRVGRPDRAVQRVAVCSGSGGSLLDAFFASGADVFITGDIRYHDARTAEDRGRCLIDIGHFESEHLIVEVLRDRLQKQLDVMGCAVSVDVSPVEQSPFQVL